jgi:hypothetical protein
MLRFSTSQQTDITPNILSVKAQDKNSSNLQKIEDYTHLIMDKGAMPIMDTWNDFT